MTVRGLLRHMSGVTHGFFGNTEPDKRYRQMGVPVTERTLEDTIDKLSRIPFLFQPGICWHYIQSASSYVLGRVTEVVSGRSLDEFFRNWTPVGVV